MIVADVHTHTYYGHGKNSVYEMFSAGRTKGLHLQGFSEHSPRPAGYDYPVEYRKHLEANYDRYIAEVRHLQSETTPRAGGVSVLLGVELDWIEGQTEFMKAVLAAHDYDYVIGGIHFLGNWGFDWSADDWVKLSVEDKEDLYVRYYRTMLSMVNSRMFNIVAHPDLIKLFSRMDFDNWLEKPGRRDVVCLALSALREAGMAMEISSAGLRKPCREIYPGPIIMSLAAELHVPISFGSDGHCVETLAANFDTLADYAAGFGYTEHLVFNRGDILRFAF